nr:hypothetical protein [Tanacetum cinerariifolium]
MKIFTGHVNHLPEATIVYHRWRSSTGDDDYLPATAFNRSQATFPFCCFTMMAGQANGMNMNGQIGLYMPVLNGGMQNGFCIRTYWHPMTIYSFGMKILDWRTLMLKGFWFVAADEPRHSAFASGGNKKS